MNLGVAGEFTYTDPDIQTAINTKFTSEMKITAADNEAIAAKKFAAAADAIKMQKEVDGANQIRLALAEAIRTGKLPVPNTLVMGNNQSLIDVYAAKNLSSK